MVGMLPHRADDLPVQLFEERLYEGLVTIHAQIIGQSHVIRYQMGDTWATETLMCPPDGFEVGTISGQWKALLPYGPMREQLQVGHLQLEMVLLRKPYSRLEKDRLKMFLDLEGAFSHRFPSIGNSGKKKNKKADGWTAIQADAERGMVRTMHLYPEENRIIWSRTRLILG